MLLRSSLKIDYLLKNKVSFLLCFLFLLHGCSIKKLIPANKILLQKVTIRNASRDYRKNLYPLIIQRPRNKGIISSQPYLWFYMKLDKGKDSGFKATLKKIFGEKPVYLDTNLTKESLVRLTEYNFNKGYFETNTTLKSKIRNNNQLKLWYMIDLKDPHFISDIKYISSDTNIKLVIAHDASKPLIKKGQKYDSEVLSNESLRLTTILNNNGYYKFNKNFIYYEVDTATLSKQKNVSITLYIQNFSDTALHKIYFINNIFLEPDYKLTETLKKDTLFLKEFTYITQSKILKPNTFFRHIRFSKGDLFSLANVKQTINQLSDIQFFKYIDISFVENESYKSDTAFLDCYIKLTPMNKRETSTEVEVNTTAENKVISQTSDRYYGMAGSLNFRNRNLFRQAIQLSLGVLGAFDIQSRSIAQQLLFGNYQVGLNAALYFPTAYLPKSVFKIKHFQSSKTAIDLSYFYEFNSDFTRTTTNLAYIYQLNKRFIRHFITPVELSLVKTDLQPNFAAKLTGYNDPLLNNIFETHLLTILKYSITYNDKGLKQDHYWSAFFGIETAGNSSWLFNKFTTKTNFTDSTRYTLAGFNFFQYVKGDLDVSYHYNINARNSMASRLNLGLGVPYGNSDLLPFEKRYYIGGANSIRAWPMRELGPGSFKDTSNLHYEQSGEIKIEGSVEFRFDIYSLMKGALFFDAGNIWNLKKDPQRPGGEFNINKLMSEIALGAGFGLRFDFTFFIFRTDLGFPIRDPSFGVNDRWVVTNISSGRWLLNNTHLNIGIGYPF